jgi:hypothetical protein
MLPFSTLMGKQDHVRERLWQQLLSYLSNHYYVMVYHQHDSLYVPSAAVRDNDPRCNPLCHRRFTIIRGLANSSAVQVPEGTGDNGTISTPSLSFGISSPPCISIIDHLYCPSSVHASIGNTVHSFTHGVYQVRDVHASVDSFFPSFERSFDGSKDNEHYLRTILFLDAFLQHYSLHSVLPKVLVHDLATGRFYTGLEK